MVTVTGPWGEALIRGANPNAGFDMFPQDVLDARYYIAEGEMTIAHIRSIWGDRVVAAALDDGATAGNVTAGRQS